MATVQLKQETINITPEFFSQLSALIKQHFGIEGLAAMVVDGGKMKVAYMDAVQGIEGDNTWTIE
jgi:hypothetical protein